MSIFNYFKKAVIKKGPTGHNLLIMLESRLDNTVYRLGLAPTRRAARQLVTHKHIMLNGVICNIPSAALRVGDEVSVRDRSKSLEVVTSSLTNNTQSHDWVQWNSDKMTGTVKNMPERDKTKTRTG